METGRRKMIADGRFKHDGVALKPGDEFECTEQDAADLKAMGFAYDPPTVVEEVVERVTRPYRTRNMRAH
jgi:hypothetical protein